MQHVGFDGSGLWLEVFSWFFRENIKISSLLATSPLKIKRMSLSFGALKNHKTPYKFKFSHELDRLS